jgi:hypothetical protein
VVSIINWKCREQIVRKKEKKKKKKKKKKEEGKKQKESQERYMQPSLTSKMILMDRIEHFERAPDIAIDY